MEIKDHYNSVDELRELSQQAHLLKDWRFVTIGQEPGYAVVFHPEPLGNGSQVPRIFLSDGPQLVKLAKTMLRNLDPSPEQEILEALKRIEARLPGTGER